MRLKDKLGTRQLPTAELELRGTLARKVSASGKGIQIIASMLNITRVYNAIASVGIECYLVSIYMYIHVCVGIALSGVWRVYSPCIWCVCVYLCIYIFVFICMCTIGGSPTPDGTIGSRLCWSTVCVRQDIVRAAAAC
jgi:hypothetical protein